MRRSEAGFTLIETIVALVLFAGVVVALNQGLAGSWRGIRAADTDAQATALAMSRLVSAGTETTLGDGLRTSGVEGRFNWQMSIDRYAGADDEGFQSQVVAYWVTIDVSWNDGPLRRARTVRFKTLKLGLR